MLRPILHGSLFGNSDIEEEMRRRFTYIRFTLGISEHKWDHVVKPNLEFLNTLLGLKFVMSGKSYSRYFKSQTGAFKIYNIESGPSYGSWFDMEQSLDLDFGNMDAQTGATYFNIEGSDMMFSPQFIGGDAYQVKGRAHITLTNVQRYNSCWQELLQDPKNSRAEVRS